MDHIELARQRAERLHEEAIEQGSDPWSPYQFAREIAERRGITVESCVPGASILDGARATFDAELPLIVHESSGTPFEQAFLIAHEIGHAVLGDGEDEEGDVFQIDPARTSEVSPVGIERVVDYSRRQRREVQMDLFARELLLPRSRVVELHLTQRQTCFEIATRLGAPFDVIAQQMLDALLLPPVPAVTPEAPVEIPLNDEQRIAASHRGGAFLLQAGPGTGKTRTLVARVESLLDDGVDPRRILLLTFSNKAAAEMSERVALKRPKETAALCIGTFHSFGLDILRRFNDRCGLPVDPRLMDRTEAVELLENEFPRLGLTHYRNLYDPSQTAADILTAVSRAKDEVVDPQGYLDLANAMAETADDPSAVEAAEKAMEVAKVYVRYEELKTLVNCVDFGDLVMRPVQLLEGDEAVRTQLQNDYDHILVDEYQDVNHSSVRLLKALKPSGTNLWVVGDAKQSIYRFRGASSFNMARFGREDFPGAVRDRLKINYRSAGEIVEACSAFAAGMSTADGDESLEADCGRSGNLPEVITVDNSSLLTPAIADRIQELLTSGYSYRDQAVLCRGNDRLSDVGRELERAGIPVLFLGSLFERPEVKDLVSILSLLVDRRAMGLIRAACLPEFAMCLEDVVRIFETLREVNSDVGAWRVISPVELTSAGQSALSELNSALAGFDASSQPWKVLTTILLDRTRLAARIASSSEVSDQARGIAIWQFMNFVRAQPNGQGLPIQRLSDRIRRLLRLRDDRDLRQLPSAAQGIDAVRLMTIHGSKGLEFPAVHIAGVNKDSIPGAYRTSKCPPPSNMVAGAQGGTDDVTRAAHNEEQECLFYVAMSRAKTSLSFYGATAASNGRTRALSPYLDRIGLVKQCAVKPKTVLPPAPDSVAIPIVFTGIPRFSSDAVSLYDSCARRFFYTHLLQVGGKRKMNSFMQMHEAIRDVYRQLVAQGNLPVSDWEEQLSQAFVIRGLADHGYVDDYRAMASSMLRYFMDSRAGAQVEASTTLRIVVDGHEVEVTPDEILLRNGKRIVRRVKTGHAPSNVGKDVGSAALILAVQSVFPDAELELLHLADAESKPLKLSSRELSNRQVKIAEIFREIRGGQFRTNVSDATCPNCPAFFVCGEVPAGALSKLF
ncbi:UvrD-helicase domain-containing protein [Pseudomonas donghuensis]|uniref:UvrD-helicase domain-containing protein n=1 Tax=Pseudomonas donghuensis TaxID=1163398 RepID=UPI00215F562C|nr:UvrD-helicase domain-containing protein [Pseudomonas donghuensis]UVL24086.1 UvrD-helicase domain-containing protein [Pseudomonas donghuensis]